jgi:hypothetical protein
VLKIRVVPSQKAALVWIFAASMGALADAT